MQLSNKHYRNGMKLKSTDGELEFSVFMRKNEMFHENFSIGLVFHPKDDPQEVHLITTKAVIFILQKKIVWAAA